MLFNLVVFLQVLYLKSLCCFSVLYLSRASRRNPRDCQGFSELVFSVFLFFIEFVAFTRLHRCIICDYFCITSSNIDSDFIFPSVLRHFGDAPNLNKYAFTYVTNKLVCSFVSARFKHHCWCIFASVSNACSTSFSASICCRMLITFDPRMAPKTEDGRGLSLSFSRPCSKIYFFIWQGSKGC